MTTIAYAHGVMACDSAWTDAGETVFGSLQTKLFRLSSGAVIGEAGDCDSRAVRALVDKVKSYDKMPSAADLAACRLNYTALIAFPNGEIATIYVEYDDSCKDWRGQTWLMNRGIAAVGSGGNVALGYMGAGKSAVQAVAFACQWDPYSRLPVHSMTVIRRGGPRKRSIKRA